MTPSRAARPAFRAAVARPRSRRMAMARSTSPPASSRARLQSMTPAPVRSRSARTSSGLMVMAVMIVSLSVICRCRPRASGRHLALGPFGALRCLLLFLVEVGSTTGARPPLLLLVLLRLGLEDERLAGGERGAVVGLATEDRLVDGRHRLRLLELLVEARLPFVLGLEDGFGNAGGDEADGPDGIVVRRKHPVDGIWIAVRI